MEACACNLSFKNTGLPQCKSIMSVAKKLILVPLYDEDGVRNGIDLENDVLNPAWFSDKVNESDGSQRWYPLPLMENVEDTKGDPIMEGFNSGKNVFIQEGVRTFTGIFVKQPAEYISKINSFKCRKFGAYTVDKEGSLIGSLSSGFLYPIMIDEDTLDIRLIKSTDTTSQKIQIKFEYSQTEDDSALRLINKNESGTELLLLDGLLDVNMVASDIDVDGFTINASLDYGTALNPIAVTGLVKADFTLTNVTDAAPITITSVTEGDDGEYVFVIPSQTAGDELLLAGSKDGYEFVSLTIDIPTS